MGWYLTKSQHGFEKPVWLLPTYVTYGEGEISVYQSKDEYTVRRRSTHFLSSLKL
ncbi:unnamed protein product [Schistosoma mattheei]|uniref:Uncharacterized protein n=1 Tax=Schistosoma mattheei TaxID=31246 RepID=A0A183NSM3_9TREM|nr:unnamed protein product [Schistosoma mattheei]